MIAMYLTGNDFLTKQLRKSSSAAPLVMNQLRKSATATLMFPAFNVIQSDSFFNTGNRVQCEVLDSWMVELIVER